MLGRGGGGGGERGLQTGGGDGVPEWEQDCSVDQCGVEYLVLAGACQLGDIHQMVVCKSKWRCHPQGEADRGIKRVQRRRCNSRGGAEVEQGAR